MTERPAKSGTRLRDAVSASRSRTAHRTAGGDAALPPANRRQRRIVRAIWRPAKMKKNDYGRLCTEMYELLHKEAPEDELAFYLSYARPGMSILEPLCGSGRFLVPFLRRGLSIQGMDNSREMLDRLLEKAPEAHAVLCDLEAYQPAERFDYIFIPSGSVSLFTDIETCKGILRKMKTLLKAGGRFVFAVDTTATRCPDSDVYTESVSAETAVPSQKPVRRSDAHAVQPSLYELYDGGVLLRREEMDFQIHLYEPGEMDSILKAIGFTVDAVYTGFSRNRRSAASEI
ncbi:MAG: class I SAM-dependent methyltransferase [Acutalibacteraceae bacterium]